MLHPDHHSGAALTMHLLLVGCSSQAEVAVAGAGNCRVVLSGAAPKFRVCSSEVICELFSFLVMDGYFGPIFDWFILPWALLVPWLLMLC